MFGAGNKIKIRSGKRQLLNTYILLINVEQLSQLLELAFRGLQYICTSNTCWLVMYSLSSLLLEPLLSCLPFIWISVAQFTGEDPQPGDLWNIRRIIDMRKVDGVEEIHTLGNKNGTNHIRFQVLLQIPTLPKY